MNTANIRNYKEILWIIENPEFCAGCERTLKRETVYVPPNISRYDYKSRECYTYCSERCYHDLAYDNKRVDKKTGNIYVLNNAGEYVLYDVPGKTYK